MCRFPVRLTLFLALSYLVRAESPLTVLLEFEQPHSTQSVLEMEKETQHILKPSGLKLEWRFKDSIAQSESFSDVVVVRMAGQCRMDAFPVLLDERGPLAFTHSSDGEVLPFSEVLCDKVRRSVQSALKPATPQDADKLYGRALGRVLAHEMFHMVAKTQTHGKRGVAKTTLSGLQLIGDDLPLDNHEVTELKTILESRGGKGR